MTNGALFTVFDDAILAGVFSLIDEDSLIWGDGRGVDGLRMDTWASNDTLIAYYGARGFRLVGTRRLEANPQLAVHYHGIEVALLEAPSATTR